MIVKDEAAVIGRTLQSLPPIFSSYAIVDTGSTDATIAIIKRELEYLTGVVVESEWKGFAESRNEALKVATDFGGYAVFLDADSTLTLDDGFDEASIKNQLDSQVHSVLIEGQGITYPRQAITRFDAPVRYRGVLHEFLECDESALVGGLLQGLRINNNASGVSSRNNDPYKYINDVALLHGALQTPGDEDLQARYHFYLGQSYQDAGLLEHALIEYQRCAETSSWRDEQYVARLSSARLMKLTGHDDDEVLDELRRACEHNPLRAESYHEISRIERNRRNWAGAYSAAMTGLQFTPPPNSLFMETESHQYGLLFEFSLASWYVGRKSEARDAWEKLVADPGLPLHLRELCEANAGFYVN